MSWITITWSMTASASLLLALVHGFIWWQRKEAKANGLFALSAVAAVLYSACEIRMMRAETIEAFGRAIWWFHLPACITIVSIVGFVRVYFRAGRRWLAWAVCGMRVLTVIINFFSTPNINYREITALHHVHFLGEFVSIAEGVRNPWIVVAHASLFLFVVFVADATITVWRRGDQRRVRLLASAITFFTLMVTGEALLVFWGGLQAPLTPSLFFSAIVVAMGFELSYDVLHANKLAEDLKESEERFRNLAAAAFEGIFITENGRVIDVNDQGLKMFGYERAEMIGREVAELVSPQTRSLVQEAIRTQRETAYEHQLIRKDGSAFHAEAQAKMVRVGNRTLRMTAIREITARKRAEAALEHERALLRTLIDLVPDFIFIKDTESRFLVANQSLAKSYGRIPAEILNHTDADFIESGLAANCRASEQKVLASGAVGVFEDTVTLPDGRVRTISTHMVAFRNSQGQVAGLVGIGRDITAHKQAEMLADGQRQVLEMMACDAPIKDTLEALLQTIEAQADEMICSILVMDADGIHLRHGAASRLPEAYIQAIDGVAIGPAVGSCGTAAFHRKQVVVEDIATDPLWENYKAIALSHGLHACWSTPIFDAQQKVLGTFAVYYSRPRLPDKRHLDLIATATHTAAIAISRQRAKGDLQESEKQLRQSQKMEAIGQLAGGVAHDFNNILASTLMQVELVRTEENLSDTVKDGLKQIRADAERAANLTRQLLLFSRRQTMQPLTLNLNEQVINLFKMLQRIIGEDVHLELHLHPVPLMTHADAGMLDQVLMNLVVNARDAMPGGGRLRIETTEKTVTEGEPLPHPEAMPGHFVCLKVSDTGRGIAPEILPRIFEPFFTTKAEGKGTGLGLATVYGIVKQHHGWIQVDNRPGEGVTFHIFLPASSVPAETSSSDTKFRAFRGTETILLVEDEPGLLTVTRKVLVRNGYQVLTATNGQEALKQWQEHHGEVALLLTDLVMPGGMTGQELGEQLRADQPELKVVFTSGYSAEIAGREIQLHIGENFLQKPFAPGQLLKVVRESLDG